MNTTTVTQLTEDAQECGDILLPYLHQVCQGGPVTAEKVAEAIDLATRTAEKWTNAALAGLDEWQPVMNRLAASTWVAHRMNAVAAANQ